MLSRKQIEEAFAHQAETYRALLSTTLDGVVETDHTGRFLDANQVYCRMLGYTRTELLAMGIWDVEGTEQESQVAEHARKMQREGGGRFETKHRAKDGRLIDLELNVTYLPEPQRFIAFCHDITDRKEAKQALEMEVRRRQLMFELAPDGVVILDPQTGRIAEFNTAAHEQLGYSREEFSRLSVFDIEVEETATETKARIASVIEGGKDDFITRQRAKSGAIKHIHVTAQLIKATDRQVYHCTWRDITARQEAEMEMLRLNRALRATMACGQALVRAATEQELLQEVCRIIVEVGGYRFTWVGSVEQDAGKRVFPQAHAGYEAGYLQNLAISWENSERGLGPAGRAIRSGQPCVVQDIQTESDYSPWREEAIQRGYLASIALPLKSGNSTFALLSIYAANPGAFDVPETELLTRLAADLAYGINTLRTRDAHEQAAAALRGSEERYRSLVETTADWIWEVDIEGRYTYASPQVKQLLGYTPEEVIGRSPFDLMGPEEAKRVGGIFREIIARQGIIIGLENTNLHRDGRQVTVETNGVPFFSREGVWLGYRGMDRDITGRLSSDRMLRLQGAALAAAANAILITDIRGLIEWANPAFTHLSGWTAAEAIGRNPGELLHSGRHDPAFYKKMWDTILAGKVWQGEVVNRRKDGNYRTEEMTITPLRDPQGRITHFIAIKQDVTEQKHYEAQFRQAQRMEAMGTLAGGIAHDLNNILSPVLLVSGMLKEKLEKESDREMLDMITREAQRGANIIMQLLTFSRGLEGERTAVQPRHIIKELVNLMRETFPREINLQQKLPGALWTVLADPTQLHQVVLNLCVNARDAMPHGGRLVLGASNLMMEEGDPRLESGAKPGPYILVEVQDSGHGIPEKILQNIFEPFFTTKPLGKGTGLGLSTVLGIVKSHGGFVRVQSVVDQGSAFQVFLPALPETVVPEAPEILEKTAAGRGQWILVVDDERSLREAAQLVLENHGYRVLVAVNGDDALAVYRQNMTRIKLVLTDLMMPVMNGLTLIRHLRKLNGRLPVIATSGMGEIDQHAELRSLGVAEFLTKPFSGNTLVQVVQAQLELRD